MTTVDCSLGGSLLTIDCSRVGGSLTSVTFKSEIGTVTGSVTSNSVVLCSNGDSGGVAVMRLSA